MDKEKLEHLRHSAAHLLAAAVMELYPNTKRTIGPAIENGFYYDFDFGDVTITEEDLPKIEEKMGKLLKDWKSFNRREISADEAKAFYKDNPYKIELIEQFAGEGQTLTMYDSINYKGEAFYTDLCRGGHAEQPKKEIGAFKLLSLAGAYWRGDEKNKMLTRIYGTAFPTKEELDAYLNQLEEARKRDHKRLGKELGLFVFSELVGPGLPLWTPKGTILRNLLDDYVWELRKARGYVKVTIPHITKKELYETSGHWSKFADELFRIKTREGHEFAMKPMNCPHHTQIFNSIQRSYKDMPQRFCETTFCYRDEQTGELSGLSRVRSFTQDDAHAFARVNQLEEEFSKVWDIVDSFYSTFGFKLRVRLSLHDPSNMEAYLGSPERWENAADALRKIAKERKADYFEAAGEAAFYGPKMDFMATDAIGREWQVATIQLDMNMPERFDLFCINEQGEQERIVMIHAAIMGSIERFLSILIEHYAGAFPTWLSPQQISIIPISDKHVTYAKEIAEKMLKEDIRVEVDDRSETMQSKIRDAQLQKVPYMIVVGDKEMEANQISVRSRTGENKNGLKLEEFLEELKKEISEKK